MEHRMYQQWGAGVGIMPHEMFPQGLMPAGQLHHCGKAAFVVGDMVRHADASGGMKASSMAGVVSAVTSGPNDREQTFIVECGSQDPICCCSKIPLFLPGATLLELEDWSSLLCIVHVVER
jgi:hypothetical protein